MTFTEDALRMFPFWLMGLVIIISTLSSKNKDLLRVNFSAIKKTFLILTVIAIMRSVAFRLFMTPEQIVQITRVVGFIPIGGIFFVWWEDAVFTMSLEILRRSLNNRWYSKIFYTLCFMVSMVVFCSGHLYQGLGPAMEISLYIPFTTWLARKYGFGSTMIMHVMYDFSTLTLLKILGH